MRSLGLAGLIFLAGLAVAKDKEPAGAVVDSGTFGVFMGGVRVGTETFAVHQAASGSVVTSEFKSEKGAEQAVQSSDLRLNAGGDLQNYEWKESSPAKVRAEVLPSESFLIERVTNNPDEKPEEQPFLLPASTSILDDYFFVQREVLIWKFLATACRHDQGPVACPAHQKAQFGSMNPHARNSSLVSIEFAGREKVAIRGAQRDLGRFDLKGDSTGDYSLWVDEQFKVVRILLPAENTEVVRD